MGYSFKQFIKNKVEHEITSSRKNKEKVQIADLSLTYDNGDIISLLKERGKAIAETDLKKVKKIEE